MLNDDRIESILLSNIDEESIVNINELFGFGKKNDSSTSKDQKPKKQNPGQQNQNPENAEKTGAKIEVNDNTGNGSNTNKDVTDNAKKKVDYDQLEKEMCDNVTKKWKTACQAIYTAKLTAIQNISKDYMAIIRQHVKSYHAGKSDNEVTKTKADVDNSTNNNAEITEEQPEK